MHISKIHIYQHDLPVVNGPYVMASGEVWSVSTTLVRLIADNGVEGWGEVCPASPTYAEAHQQGARAALKQMAAGLIGTEALPLIVQRKMNNLLCGHHYAKAAFDIAVHDLLGKHLRVSVTDLLGGAVTNHVPSYYSTGVGDPDETARIVAEKCAEGYPRIQVKVSGRPVEIDIETIHKVWEKMRGTNVRLAIDANRGWKTRDVIRVTQACRDIPFVMEQPCDTLEDLKTIRPLVSHAIYMDENGVDLSTVIHAVGAGLVDGFGMKVTRMGGLQNMRAFRDICEARNVPHSCDDTWGGDIMAAACTQIAATMRPDLCEGAWIAAPYIEGNYDKVNGIRIKGGHIARPQGTGLGITIDASQFGDPIASF